MKTLLLVGAGSFLGGMLRFGFSMMFPVKLGDFPWNTFLINLIGCFAIGMVYGITSKLSTPNEYKLFLATGLLGGFTTFSAFSLESISMVRNGDIYYALMYVLGSITLGLGLTGLGLYVYR